VRTRCVGLVIVACLVGAAAPVVAAAAAQSAVVQAAAPPLVELRLKDGSVLYGTIQTETAERVVLRSIAGVVLAVERAQIASLRPAHGEVVDGEFQPADSNATRLLFSPTGRSLRKGQGYVGVYEFLLPFVQYGVTDRLTMGAGTPLIFFGDESSRPVWLTPKYQFYKGPRTSAAVGVMHFVLFGADARVGLAYAVATTGSDDNAWTIGAGWAYARYDEDEYPPSCAGPGAAPVRCEPDRVTQTHGSPVLMVGGERRVSRRVKLISENYVFKDGGFLSAGVRFLGDRLSADLGVFTPLSTDVFLVAPIVNFVWTFEK
jgi:hypothetical protein